MRSNISRSPATQADAESVGLCVAQNSVGGAGGAVPPRGKASLLARRELAAKRSPNRPNGASGAQRSERVRSKRPRRQGQLAGRTRGVPRYDSVGWEGAVAPSPAARPACWPAAEG